jgi:hypothetical protein
MNRRSGQPWWSGASFKIRTGVFCLVELARLELATPCLQIAVSTCVVAADLEVRASGSVRE